MSDRYRQENLSEVTEVIEIDRGRERAEVYRPSHYTTWLHGVQYYTIRVELHVPIKHSQEDSYAHPR